MKKIKLTYYAIALASLTGCATWERFDKWAHIQEEIEDKMPPAQREEYYRKEREKRMRSIDTFYNSRLNNQRLNL